MNKKSRASKLVLVILSIDLMVGLGLVISNLFVDYEEIYTRIALSNVLRFEIAETLLLVLLEVGLAVGLFMYIRMISSHQYFRESVLKMIGEGENDEVEFKQSLRFDVNQNRVNKALEAVVIKTLTGFLNGEGGSLIIGVTDERKMVGLDKDYATLPKKSCDGFENHLSQLIIEACGVTARQKIAIEFASFDKAEVCVVTVKPNDAPVYIKEGNEEYFYLRIGNGTRPLSISKATEYIESHFKNGK